MTDNNKHIIDYPTWGTCSSMIHVETDDGIVTRVRFTGGCSGNTQGVARLVAGMPVEEAIAKLEGIRCGAKPTSCPDQLAQALRSTLERDKNN